MLIGDKLEFVFFLLNLSVSKILIVGVESFLHSLLIILKFLIFQNGIFYNYIQSPFDPSSFKFSNLKFNIQIPKLTFDSKFINIESYN